MMLGKKRKIGLEEFNLREHPCRFPLELSQRHTYEQMASAVAKKIDADPNKIQFFKCQRYSSRLVFELSV